MITSLQVDGYRGLKDFRMDGLGRINLLVGKNNCGKTSVLEAVYLLTTGAQVRTLVDILSKRGERWPTREEQLEEFDPSHLFENHLLVDRAIHIAANNEPLFFVRISAVEAEQTQFLGRGLQIKVEHGPDVWTHRLAGKMLVVSPADLKMINLLRLTGRDDQRTKFIPGESLPGEILAPIWDGIALSPLEDLVLRAVRILDPKIERLASQSQAVGSARSGFLVKLQGHEMPFPLGSMGDGTWRMMALSIALTQCRGDYLLVDEIDTGLHYSALEAMWKLVYQTACELDVQVFATTHNIECVHALSAVGEAQPGNSISVQRIRGERPPVSYDESELLAAAEHMIEVR